MKEQIQCNQLELYKNEITPTKKPARSGSKKDWQTSSINCSVDIRCLDSKDGRFMVVSLHNKNNHRKKDDNLCLCSLHKNKTKGRARTSVFQPYFIPVFSPYEKEAARSI